MITTKQQKTHLYQVLNNNYNVKALKMKEFLNLKKRNYEK